MLRAQGQRCLHSLPSCTISRDIVRQTIGTPLPLLPLTTRRFKRTRSKRGGRKPSKSKARGSAATEKAEDHGPLEFILDAQVDVAPPSTSSMSDSPKIGSIWTTLREKLSVSPPNTNQDETSVDSDPTRLEKLSPPDSAQAPIPKAAKAHQKEEALAKAGSRRAALSKTKMKPASDVRILRPNKLKFEPVEQEIKVPRLAHKLEQVLFTQGPNQLQDPRTQVFNFDPYLASIMPVDEFDFAALKEYITSSKDTRLRDMAKKLNKKYCGSTSSMTNILSHFHYLLSAWRKPNYSALSKGFEIENPDFTRLSRGPAAAYARYQDGVYAIDADKQYDTESILSMLGKSMEKLLTLPKDEFEKYRITRSHQISEEERNADEAFHYTTLGDFMMRSQLDAYDPRLPGAGVFDLKTRAVVSIRMDVTGYEKGQGYEIRYFRGQWESFEREYYDMIRAAFLKYSLQVRMGRMDGIFVAFHNTKRIFGFQYISLEEMDLALHGSRDCSLGDAEFKASISLLNTLMDRATKRFPGRSLRLHVETRPTKVPLTYFFVTPVTDEEIQTSEKKSQAAAERTAERLEEISRHQQVPTWEPEQTNVEQPHNAVDEVPDEKPDQPSPHDLESNQVWDELMTAVGEVVENDSQGLASVRGALQDALAQNNLLVDRTTEESEQYLDALVDALTSNSTDLNEDREVSEDELVYSTNETPEPVPVDASLSDADAEREASVKKPTVSDGEQESKSADPQILLRDLIVKVTDRIDERTTELRTFEKVIAELAARSKLRTETAVSEGARLAESSDAKGEEQTTFDQRMETTAPTKTSEDESSSASVEEASSNNDPSSSENDVDKDSKTPQELFGMYVTIRNRCGGKFVERPTGQDAKDWTVQYSITELPKVQAQSIYTSIQKRRRRTLYTDAAAKDKQWYRAWGGKMSEITKKGEQYRDHMNKQEHGKPVYVSWGEIPISPEEAYTYDPDGLSGDSDSGYRPKFEDEAEDWDDPEGSEPEENKKPSKAEEEG